MAPSRWMGIWAFGHQFGQSFASLPSELKLEILYCAGAIPRPECRSHIDPSSEDDDSPSDSRRHPAEKPPRIGCPLLKLPLELRRHIFMYELVSPKTCRPHCCDDKKDCATKHVDRIDIPAPQSSPSLSDSPPEGCGRSLRSLGLAAGVQLAKLTEPTGAPRRKKKSQTTRFESSVFTASKLETRNRATQFMSLCKKLKGEIACILYEERTFTLHIHEGLKHGGIEFVNSGRQKLQYKDEVIQDSRFARFNHREEHGFDRLKKIKIVIVPPSVDETGLRHPHVHTFFMIWSLCQLLQKSVEKHKLDFLTIDFAAAPAGTQELIGRRAIARSDRYLWDGMAKQPSTTTFDGLPDIEMILRPFAILRAHNVTVTLPPILDTHAPTKLFITTLEQRILSKIALTAEYDPVLLNEDYAHQFRAIHGDWLRFTLSRLYTEGKPEIHVPDLTEQDFQTDINEDDYLPDSVPASFLGVWSSHGSPRKRKSLHENDFEASNDKSERTVRSDEEDEDSEIDFGEADFERLDRDMQRALQASMETYAREASPGK
ncbi:hypothetical protein LTR86_007019 [Recurvomyces mirabilis]|nr:hypothetical protein LTR86_007019 [Recurvomyces mirabilis]